MASGESSATIPIRVIPRSKRAAVGGERAGRLLVRVTAPPLDGRANAAVVAALARTLGVPKRSVSIVSGSGARDKTVRIDGIAAADGRIAALCRDGRRGSGQADGAAPDGATPHGIRGAR